MSAGAGDVEALLRTLTPQVLGTLVRRHGQFDLCEDAVQEATIAAAAQWSTAGLPDDPRAWLTTVADRRAIDAIRSERARRDRETAVAAEAEALHGGAAAVGATGPGEAAGGDAAIGAADAFGADPGDEDDTLRLLLLCCHPSLTPASQIALTLRAVGGLTTAQIAHAFLIPERTMGQRISRAKRTIRAAGARFELPAEDELPARLATVLQVLYLIFNEGHTGSSGADLTRPDLTAEAIHLARELQRLRPQDGEVAGLLALMLLTDAHRDARVGPDGMLVTLDRQDRTRWDRAAIAEGVALVERALAETPLGPYQVQAAIAAVHAEARTADATDWPQILALYGVLERLAPGPMVALNRAAAYAMVHGPQAGLDQLDALAADARLANHHRLAAVRGHLLQRLGDHAAAAEAFRTAARRTTSLPEQRYLEAQASRMSAARAASA